MHEFLCMLCKLYHKVHLYENLLIKEKLSSHLNIVKPWTSFQGG